MTDGNCFIPYNDSKCSLCIPGWAANIDFKCMKGPDGCQFRIADDRCAVCSEGAYIDASGKCIGTPKPVPDFSSSRWITWLLVILFILLIAGLVMLYLYRLFMGYSILYT